VDTGMNNQIIILTNDETLRETLQGTHVPDLIVTSCLDDLGIRKPRRFYVLTDPRTCCPGCRNRLNGAPRVVARSPDLVVEPDASPRGARTAWETRQTILSPREVSALAHRFLEVAEMHRAESYSVTEAARDMDISARHLHRVCRESFGQAAGTLLGLVRVVSVARAIEERRLTLGEIARVHGYADGWAMHRHFVRYLGVGPSHYRSSVRPRRHVAESVAIWHESSLAGGKGSG
jgi:AraC-like DNA-binding protein